MIKKQYRHRLKRTFLTSLLTFSMICGGLCTGLQSASAQPTADAALVSDTSSLTDKTEGEESSQNKQPFVELTGDELIADMGAGWNLGNTMDGHTGFTPGETVWQNVKTTKKLIKSVHDMGFNTVRIPVTWGTMIDDDNDYAIDEAWLSRVQDIVDYCISQDMYTIINIHHDGAEQTGWLRIATEDQDGLAAKFGGVWKNIATAFKDYDEHLIFESMNEVQGVNMTVAEENQVIMKLNQIFVDTVRATGSNNAKRWLMVPGKYNYIDSICNPDNEFSLPDDSVSNRIILSVHCYTPWVFCGLESTGSVTYREYSVTGLGSNDRELKPLYDTYTSKGIPVVVGEYGCINKDNPVERAFYLEGMNRLFKKYKLVGVYWDQGWYDRSQTPDYSFSLIDRNTGEPIEKDVTDALMRGFFSASSTEDYTTLEKSPEVIPMTSLNVSDNNVSLAINETAEITTGYEPSDSNDVIFWKTDDPTVATVAYGKIHAKGEGTTTVTAFTQNGTATQSITVTVSNAQAETPCTGLSLGQSSLSLAQGAAAYLQPQLTPAETDETVYYRSSDENIATVSSIGKIVATGVGTATITAYTTGGQKAELNLTVTEADAATDVKISINVYYNDSSKQYYANEISENTVSFSGNGKYQLTFDCATDLSDAAKEAGVTNLSNLTAIYIKDYDVAKGKASSTPLSSCQIRYDKIVVNDTELTLTNTDYKSALKDSGIFDTNDPINGWDGSAVQEVSTAGNAVSFTTVSNPTKITIYFTLNQVCFEGGEMDTTDPDTPAATDTPTDSPTPPAESPAATAPSNVSPGTTSAPSTPAAVAVKKGDKKTVNGVIYQVTSAGTKKEVAAAGIKKALRKKTTSCKIASSVKIQGDTYKVTSIKANAFKKNTKLKKVTIPSSVKTIGKNAWKNCKNLKKITFLAKKPPEIGKNAFKNISAKARFSVPKAGKKLYKKKLTASVGYKKNMKIV